MVNNVNSLDCFYSNLAQKGLSGTFIKLPAFLCAVSYHMRNCYRSSYFINKQSLNVECSITVGILLSYDSMW